MFDNDFFLKSIYISLLVKCIYKIFMKNGILNIVLKNNTRQNAFSNFCQWQRPNPVRLESFTDTNIIIIIIYKIYNIIIYKNIMYKRQNIIHNAFQYFRNVQVKVTAIMNIYDGNEKSLWRLWRHCSRERAQK